MELFDLLDACSDLARGAIARVEPGHHRLPTPCPDWDVLQLTTHLVAGEAAVVPMLERRPEDVLAVLDRDGLPVADDPLGAWDRHASAASDALRRPGALEGTALHPYFGDMPGLQLAGFRMVDRVAHAWDLEVALGGDGRLPADLVDAVYGLVSIAADSIPRSVFADAVEVPGDASAQVKLLALLGRRA